MLRKLDFYKNQDGLWYVDLPEWPGEISDLQMVSGADTMLDIISCGSDRIALNISDEHFEGSDALRFIREAHELDNGAFYMMEEYKGMKLNLEMWLCDVTKFVFANFPGVVYVSEYSEHVPWPKSKLNSKYSMKLVNPNFYSKIEVSGQPDRIGEGPGHVMSPFVFVEHTEESLKEYNEFMSAYRTLHEVCPKCGATGHSTTLFGYVLNWEKKEEYKDLNTCVCSECGDKHTAHQRISAEEFQSTNLKNKRMHIYQLRTAKDFYNSIKENLTTEEIMQLYAEDVAKRFAAECVNEALGNKMEASNALHDAINNKYKSIVWENQ